MLPSSLAPSIPRIGIGGPVGSGKTALLEALVPRLVARGLKPLVITNDIFTSEDREHARRTLAGCLDADRIRGVETGSCPHAAVRDDPSLNLLMVEELTTAYPDGDILLIESGGDNLTLTFSPALADYQLYVIDVAAGDKIPRKRGQGITQTDLLVINKTDLAPHVGADLGVMRRDAERVRGGKPFLFTNCRTGDGVGAVEEAILAGVGLLAGHAAADLAVRPFAGLADLTFAPRDGRTRLVRSLTRPPLTVGRVLYPDEGLPDLAHLILANPTAGVFAGDRLAIRVRVRAGGRAHLTTQAATRLHPMAHGIATQRIHLAVEPGATLEWLPDPTIPFRDARFSQTTTLTVAPGGTLIYSDILTPGRVAMGESLAYTRLHTRLIAQTPDRTPLYREALSLLPGHRPLLGRALLGPDAASLGTLLVVSDALAPEALRDALREVLGALGDATVRWGVATLPGGSGICVKALGTETQRVESLLRAAWGAARQLLWGVGSPPTRKY